MLSSSLAASAGSSSLSGKEIAGIVLGVIFSVLGCVVAVVFAFCRIVLS